MNADARAIAPTVRVIALCAAWCGVCRDWRPVYLEAVRAHPEWQGAWVDVEDEDEAVGGIDITTFPTVLIARGTQALFLGPIAPSRAALERLASGLAAQNACLRGDAQALLDRLLPDVVGRCAT